MSRTITPADLKPLAATKAVTVLDVRRQNDYDADPVKLPGAEQRNPEQFGEWSAQLPRDHEIVIYCARGGSVSNSILDGLLAKGFKARFIEGGIEAWKGAGGATMAKQAADMKWVTRERPKIDRIACPWLIARFIDREAEFLYVPAADVLKVAQEQGAIPYDVPDVEYGHVGELCSFDAFLNRHELTDPALRRLATIVRGADTGRPDLAPQSHGLLAISLGLSRNFPDDHEMLRVGMIVYDALYAWCRTCVDERHG